MANDLMTLDQEPPPLPVELEDQLTANSNLPERQTVPSLSYKGKVWSINTHGEEIKIEGKNADGDVVPLPVMRVIILDLAKKRGRAYYSGPYDPAKVTMPNCWSDDGDKPSRYVKEPESSSCALCPMAAKGSKVTDGGKETRACQQHRMVAVVPAAKPFDFPPLRLKLAITSDFDSQSPDHEAKGWFSFKRYIDDLKVRGVGHTMRLVTKMKFDPNVAYPKVLFARDKWVAAETVEQLAPIAFSEEVKALIGGSWTPNGLDGTPATTTDEPEAAPKATVAAVRPASVETAATVRPRVMAATPAARPATVATAARPTGGMSREAIKATTKPAPEEDDEGVEMLAPGSPEPAARPAVRSVQERPVAQTAKPGTVKPKADAPAVSENPTTDSELEDLLTEWKV